MTNLLGFVLQWDPQIRGMLIVFTAVLVLPGSVYLLLATNTGARLGFLIALTGFSGLFMVLSGVWTVFALAQGPRGQSPEWEVKELITGPIASQTTLEQTAKFPKGWKPLHAGDTQLGDAASAADKVLAPNSAAPAPHGAGAKQETEVNKQQNRFSSPFSATTDYLLMDGYDIGGENYFPGGWKNSRGFLHRPHFAIIQVGSVVPQVAAPGAAPPKPRVDLIKPITTVVLERNLHHPALLSFLTPWWKGGPELSFMSGTRSLPLNFFLHSLIWFSLLCWILHARDKEAMAARVGEAVA